jgi:cell division protein FtsQ
MVRRRRHGASVRGPRVPGPWRITGGRPLMAALLLAGIGFGLYSGIQKLLDPVVFPLRHIHIVGELRNLNKADLQPLVERYLGQNFFVLDIDALQAAFAANPWIEHVAVRRRWPDGLEVRFRERIAFGFWGQDEMVDVNGIRFRPGVIRESGPWPRLLGPDGQEETVIRTYREASALVDKIGLAITQLVQDERRAWWLKFANGVEVNLGREQFTQRLQRFVAIYPQVLAGRIAEIAAVDLRYSNGFAVRWN